MDTTSGAGPGHRRAAAAGAARPPSGPGSEPTNGATWAMPSRHAASSAGRDHPGPPRSSAAGRRLNPAAAASRPTAAGSLAHGSVSRLNVSTTAAAGSRTRRGPRRPPPWPGGSSPAANELAASAAPPGGPRPARRPAVQVTQAERGQHQVEAAVRERQGGRVGRHRMQRRPAPRSMPSGQVGRRPPPAPRRPARPGRPPRCPRPGPAPGRRPAGPARPRPAPGPGWRRPARARWPSRRPPRRRRPSRPWSAQQRAASTACVSHHASSSS